VSDSSRVSATHLPGRGSGTLDDGTGSHIDVLKVPGTNVRIREIFSIKIDLIIG
jgi:hypothetical protein